MKWPNAAPNDAKRKRLAKRRLAAVGFAIASCVLKTRVNGQSDASRLVRPSGLIAPSQAGPWMAFSTDRQRNKKAEPPRGRPSSFDHAIRSDAQVLAGAAAAGAAGASVGTASDSITPSAPQSPPAQPPQLVQPDSQPQAGSQQGSQHSTSPWQRRCLRPWQRSRPWHFFSRPWHSWRRARRPPWQRLPWQP